jgi:hypothetical protein
VAKRAVRRWPCSNRRITSTDTRALSASCSCVRPRWCRRAAICRPIIGLRSTPCSAIDGVPCRRYRPAGPSVNGSRCDYAVVAYPAGRNVPAPPMPPRPFILRTRGDTIRLHGSRGRRRVPAGQPIEEEGVAWCIGILSYRGAYQVRAFRQVAGGSSGACFRLGSSLGGRSGHAGPRTRWSSNDREFE